MQIPLVHILIVLIMTARFSSAFYKVYDDTESITVCPRGYYAPSATVPVTRINECIVSHSIAESSNFLYLNLLYSYVPVEGMEVLLD